MKRARLSKTDAADEAAQKLEIQINAESEYLRKKDRETRRLFLELFKAGERIKEKTTENQ
ncbi:MAG: hypothetical protein H6926_04050 [Chromatiales bacterium]|nr:hypothetical protein [Gammaproteobacteria bacterium]MCP5352347.1 hypothetical protein [Chromatiales bacterium]